MLTEQFDGVSPTVGYRVIGGIAVIRLANQPVNGLGDTVRAGIDAGIERAAHDSAVTAVVIIGAGKGFCGGADIRQFNTPAASADPVLRELFDRMQRLSKPIIASISGFALGGGLELALACHHRIADGNAKIGLTEVNLGLIPGAGGTQRLPRLIGTRAALNLIQTGAVVSGNRAAALGIVDSTFAGDPLDAGLSYAQKVVDEGSAVPLIDRLPPAQSEELDFAAVRAGVRRNARNALAQQLAIDCVEMATRVPVEEGLDHERTAFVRLVDGPESKALRHVFFAEKRAAKTASDEVGTRQVERTAIVGAGTMGRGIAMAFANAHLPVTLIERDRDALDRGMAAIRHDYDALAGKGKLTSEEVTERMNLIEAALDLHAAADAPLVIEAVFEDMDVKKELFANLDQICTDGAILASNTSWLDIDEIALATARPSDVIGLHFFSPAHVMGLLEVVQGEKTSAEVIATSMGVAQRIGKVPVLAKVGHGFIGNRMLSPYRREADFLLEEGATPQQVDSALTDFGLAMGPFAMADLAGLDIGWAARRQAAATRPKHLRYSKVADRICEAGRLGQKTGEGYYRYEEGSRTPITDSVVSEIIERCAAEDSIERRTISDQEIVDRCVLALVNEGATLLSEGIAQRASDIDVVYVNGYGFPAYRGGPMYHAQSIGLDVTLRKIQNLHEVHGELWAPAPLLERLVSAGEKTF